MGLIFKYKNKLENLLNKTKDFTIKKEVIKCIEN